jgi:hypothetical protein
MLQGAIIGAITGLIVYVFMYFSKEQKFNKLLRTVTDPGLEYAAAYHFATAGRFKNGFKFFDSYGILYLVGNTLHYKTGGKDAPLSFNLAECKVQQEPDWKLLKWFSVMTPNGQKYYFNSHKMGAFKNNSDETLKGLQTLQAKASS